MFFNLNFLLALIFSIFVQSCFNENRHDYHHDHHKGQSKNHRKNHHKKSFDEIKLSCRNEITGDELDWFTLYKLPKKSEIDESSFVENPYIASGTAYTFMKNSKTNWKLSNLSMNDTQSFAGKTLEPLYNNNLTNPNSTIGYILYNDQADKVTLIKGHTKGVILFNKISAIWIVHSIPHFPPKPSSGNYSISPSQCVYGQSMVCLSLNVNQLPIIGNQLLYNYPQIYDYYIPEHLKYQNANIDNLLKVINGDHVRQAPWYSVKLINTIGGQTLVSFAKFTNFEDDLYSGLVSKSLSSNLLTETWNNGAGTLPSNCTSEYQVHNIEQVNFNFIKLRFSVHHDHSKWAVTTGNEQLFFDKRKRSESNKKEKNNLNQTKIACIGDINRQEEQFKRSGGTVCFMNNEDVWTQYNNLVDQIEPCPRKKMIRSNKPMSSRKFSMSLNTSEQIIML